MNDLKRVSSTAERLNYLLKKRNWKQVDLVNKTGINKVQISRYLKGTYLPKQDNIYKLAKAFNVSEAYLMGLDVPEQAQKFGEESESIKIPVLGKVAAGIPIEQIEDVLDFEEIPKKWSKYATYFGLQIKGDSMSPRMCDGDVVIVRVQQTIESNQIGIVSVGLNEATCKKIKRTESGIMLVPLNSNYDTVFYTNEEIEKIPITILGRVVECRCKF